MAKTSKDKTIAVKCKLINKNRSCARVICYHRGGGICLEYFAELEERTLLNARGLPTQNLRRIILRRLVIRARN